MTLFRNGSRHAWLADSPEFDQIVVTDDVTNHDRGSLCLVTAQAGGKVDRLHPTQVSRAREQLGISISPLLVGV